ncbi:hypothetical protein T484DRAFT_2122452 [Baffinella frigidus]|nr:hypothetical protein T484DRAFT_2122452 [Cryptophyta sp. CCMP2293]
MGCASSNAAASPKVPAAASAPPRLPGTQIFLTHDWADDELGRSNHARVKHVYLRLKAMGITAWFDEEEMRGDINGKMAEGIDNAKTVGVFVTKRYIDKASGKGDAGANDNCKFEVCPFSRRVLDVRECHPSGNRLLSRVTRGPTTTASSRFPSSAEPSSAFLASSECCPSAIHLFAGLRSGSDGTAALQAVVRPASSVSLPVSRVAR